jgi:hypothetical protein
VRRWIRRHWLVTTGALAVVLLGGGAAALLLVFRNHATPVSVGAAVSRFRHEDSGAPSRSSLRSDSLPPAGVYVYRTLGGEGLSLPNGDRAYPNRTTMTVTPSPCGVIVQWAAIVEHSEQYEECLGPGGSITMVSSSVTETFFGVQTRDTVTCSPGAYLRPPTLTVGERWTFACTEPQEQWRGSGQLIGIQPVAVGRDRIMALHTRIVVDFTGKEEGTNPSDYWFALDDSRLLAWRGSVDVSQGSSPLGSVDYHEQYDLALIAATPVR